MKRLLIPILWFPVTILTIFFSFSFYNTNQANFVKAQEINSQEEIATITQMPYKFYTSLPEVLGAKTVNEFAIKAEDVTPELIYQYLKKHDSPMIYSSSELIAAAQAHNIEPLFMVAIAQCESNLGKKMPHKTEDIYECHNPFGWGIHKGGTLCFDTWEEGYYAVAEGLREKYIDQGLSTTEEIMTMYTPSALEREGSWAKCVNKFLQELNEMKNEM